MGKIRILDTETINKIAAGEVVSRPFSVVKELIENSLDANATKIRITVQNGGKSFIEISDDGIGMDEEDAQLSFIRHATSKLSSVEDLFFLESMGFRGEAIPSIAAVSKFTMRTKKASSKTGIEIVIEGGKQISQNQLAISDGTLIQIKDLFYNIPARLKYLKQDQTEFMHILKFVYASSIAWPNVSFQLYNGLKKVFATSGNNNLEEVVSEVFTYDIFKQMRKIEYQLDEIGVTGYISLPSCTKVDRDKQLFFVNKRYIQSDILGKALRNAIATIFPSQRHPYCFLNISIDPSEVDINVHPAKMEAKFADEKTIYRAVYHSVRNIFEKGFIPTQPEPAPESFIREGDDKIVLSPQSYYKKEPIDRSFSPASMDMIFGEPVSNADHYNPLETFDYIEKKQGNDRQVASGLMPVMQILNTYLLFWHQDQLWVIDQHIAHERILYEALKEKKQEVISQELLLPETVFFDKTEEILYHEVKIVLSEIGFNIEAFGSGSYIIRSVPQFLINKNIKTMIKDIISETTEKDAGKKYNNILISIACKAAVKAGDSLTNMEMNKLVADWLCVKNNMSCPHGRPIAKTFMKTEIDKWFSRR
ncbi:MAG: hypothetical protein A2Y40_07635 [Candidatus Margulisbacteria bacterium GWF2_35_9]|nr:MAG: hypothetical protein A2Y40_07635 [Candidatus Margulisbacteria bacterium GWF2_35_9]